MTVDEHLVDAYATAILHGDRARAIKELREAIAADASLSARLTSLTLVVDARERCGENGCYVSKIVKSLLQEALNDETANMTM